MQVPKLEVLAAAATSNVGVRQEVKERDAFTNFVRWTVATAAECKDCWFQLLSEVEEPAPAPAIPADKKTNSPPSSERHTGRRFRLVNPTEYKKQLLHQPAAAPADFVELLGTALHSTRRTWKTARQEQPSLTHVYLVIDACQGELPPGGLQTGGGRVSLPIRWATPDIAARFESAPLGVVLAVPPLSPTLTLL